MGIRCSARYIAQQLEGFTTKDVYKMWLDMGLVVKDKFGGYSLTVLGFNLGGKVSKSNYNPVPTFDDDKIIELMIDWYNKHQK